CSPKCSRAMAARSSSRVTSMFTEIAFGSDIVQRHPARDAWRFSSHLLRRVGAVQVRPLGARQNAELDDATSRGQKARKNQDRAGRKISAPAGFWVVKEGDAEAANEQGERQQPENQQPPAVLVAVVQSLAAHGQHRPQAKEPYELRGQGDNQDGPLLAWEKKGGEGDALHRDDQSERRQPIGAAANPAVKAEKNLLQCHRILARGVLSGFPIGRCNGRFGSPWQANS